jgi:hypothetical protein
MISPKIAAVMVPLAFALAACGSIPFVSAAKPSPTPNVHQQELAYSQCMRAHGVADFPDPPSTGGGFQLQAGPGTGLDPSSATFQNADKACKSLLPAGLGGPGGISAADKQKLLAFSRCMRAHGVPDFPDPSFDSNGGGISINAGGASDMDPSSPTFQAAQKACQSLLPGKPGTTTTNGGPSGPGGTTSGSGK